MLFRIYLPLAVFTLVAAPAVTTQSDLAAQQSAAISVDAPKIASAVRADLGGPRLDGVLDDEVWQRAPIASDFLQRDPDEGEPATERTEVQVAYTDDALYVAVRAFDSQADQISAQLTRRDEYSPSDWIRVQIDSYHDRRTGFEFIVNPVGVKRDRYLYDDNNSDSSWDAVWDVATSIDSEGWTAEFRIPFSQLRFTKAEENVFGFNVMRIINRRNEEQYWKLRPKNASGVVSLFGDLVGIRGVEPRRRIEILPYTVLTEARSPSEAGNPFVTGQNFRGTMGADVNIGITSALTLTATFNPDFGQVEADAAEVNLSAFESFFREKRPFFNEGLDIFQWGVTGSGGREQLFYTRRLGRSPQGSADSRGGFAERVTNTTILTAAKLSGKTPDGWTMGLLTTVTAAERASVLGGDGAEFSDLVEPQTNYFVGRLARDLRQGQTVLGFFGTAVNRGNLENLTFLRSSAYAGGFDLNHRFRNDTYSFEGRVSATRINGSTEAITAAQLSSSRYYQRPDADHLEFDSTLTSLSGHAAAFTFGKRGGGAWRWRVGANTRSPGYEVNDIGFQRQADRTNEWIWVNKRWLQPGRMFRRFSVNLNQWGNFNSNFERKNVGGNVNANWTFLNYWSGWAGVGYQAGGLATSALRGGPAFIRPGAWDTWFGIESDGRKAILLGADGFYFTQNESGVRSYNISQWVTWRPATNLEFRFSPGFSRNIDTWQYITQTDVLNNREFVFAEIHQSTASMTFRGNMTFTPDLSVQVYAEPFVSSGNYVGYSRVTDSRGATFADRLRTFADQDVTTDENGDVSLDFNGDGVSDLGIGNPNFTFASLRSNVVLRWEYMLGSTMFFVWQHGRSSFTNQGSFDVGRSLGNLFSSEQNNTFVVKLNYWFSL